MAKPAKKEVNLVPMPGRIMVRRLESAEKSTGGIVLPERSRERLNQGIVVAVGEPLDGEPCPVTEGDRVLFGHYAGQEYDGVLYMHYADLLAKVAA